MNKTQNKIFAITSTGKSVKSFLDLRFGKCPYIFLYDKNLKTTTVLKNPFDEESNSGVQLVDYLKSKNVTTVITGEVGPRANNRLIENKLQLALLEEEKIRIDEVIDRIK